MVQPNQSSGYRVIIQIIGVYYSIFEDVVVLLGLNIARLMPLTVSVVSIINNVVFLGREDSVNVLYEPLTYIKPMLGVI
jgi:hypothetical protein